MVEPEHAGRSRADDGKDELDDGLPNPSLGRAGAPMPVGADSVVIKEGVVIDVVQILPLPDVS